MFSLFKNKKKYKTQDLVVIGYKYPEMLLTNTSERYVKMSDIITKRTSFDVYHAEICDRGLTGYITCDKNSESSTLLAKYGYSVLAPSGELIFCENILECLLKFIEKQNEYFLKNYSNWSASSLQQIRTSYGLPSASIFGQLPGYTNIYPNLFELSSVSKSDRVDIILGSNNIPIFLNLLNLLPNKSPIYLGDDVLTNSSDIFTHGISSLYTSEPPRIFYGVVYMDGDKKIKHQILDDLRSFRKVEIQVADIEKENSSVIHIKKEAFTHVSPYWSELFIYKDDITSYRSYDEYQIKNKSFLRDKKLDILLTN
jgi:hypothetical protein